MPLLVAIIYEGGWFLGVFLALAAALGASEYFVLRKGVGKGLVWIGITLSGALPLIAVLYPTYQEFAKIGFGLLVLGSVISLVMVMWLRWPQGHPIESAAVTIMGVVYTGGTLSFWIFLRALPEEILGTVNPLAGTVFLAFPIWVTWIGDCFAYVLGSAWGKRKLIVLVSPNKTVLGALGGLLGSVLGGLSYNYYLFGGMMEFSFSREMIFVTSVLIALAGQLGDLAESVMKRQAGVKDSSKLIPGHGGVLDRMDGLFFTVPMTYFIILVYL